MSPRDQLSPQRDVALVDLLDRLLAGGVVLGGDITLSIADVDLVYLQLRVLLGSVPSLDELGLALPRATKEPPA
ncbi:MAG: Gas vesicle protein [Solirubrobacterales bacterium]|nr:Gas vesicle protein [Microbacteriaceae bacterium]MCW3015212.1 Gas vesicle protein [Solirubrobacterales bacterium]